ncbi:MAG: hypothetical protein AB7O96_07565, partial [Pseudobdellovibrionaceae bacterium]
LLTISQATASELFLAHGTANVATPYGDHSDRIKTVIVAAINNARESLPQAGMIQVSPWATSHYYSGSRIYGDARASFKKPDDSGPYSVSIANPSLTANQIVFSDAPAKHIERIDVRTFDHDQKVTQKQTVTRGVRKCC